MLLLWMVFHFFWNFLGHLLLCMFCVGCCIYFAFGDLSASFLKVGENIRLCNLILACTAFLFPSLPFLLPSKFQLVERYISIYLAGKL